MCPVANGTSTFARCDAYVMPMGRSIITPPPISSQAQLPRVAATQNPPPVLQLQLVAAPPGIPLVQPQPIPGKVVVPSLVSAFHPVQPPSHINMAFAQRNMTNEDPYSYRMQTFPQPQLRPNALWPIDIQTEVQLQPHI